MWWVIVGMIYGLVAMVTIKDIDHITHHTRKNVMLKYITEDDAVRHGYPCYVWWAPLGWCVLWQNTFDINQCKIQSTTPNIKLWELCKGFKYWCMHKPHPLMHISMNIRHSYLTDVNRSGGKSVRKITLMHDILPINTTMCTVWAIFPPIHSFYCHEMIDWIKFIIVSRQHAICYIRWA